MDFCEIGLLKDRNNRIKLYGYIKEDMASLKKFIARYLKLYVAFIVAIAVISGIPLTLEFSLAYAISLIFNVDYASAEIAIFPFTIILIIMLSFIFYKFLNYFYRLKIS